MNRNLESLLRWSIENSPQGAGAAGEEAGQQASSNGQITEIAPYTSPATSASVPSTALAAPAPAAAPAASASTSVANKKLDPAIIDAILGKSDAQRMLECVQDLKGTTYDLEQKLYVWDELELLVENLDNANDMANMKLWEPIMSFLTDPATEMRLQACWVLGTAIQNNPRSQTHFLSLDPLPRLLTMLKEEQGAEMRSKVMYALSGALRHNPPAVERFDELGGWSTLNSSLVDPSVSLRRKAAFLINTLFTNTVSEEEALSYAKAAHSAGVQDTLIRSLLKNEATPAGENGEIEEIDADYEEKAVQALVTLVDKVGGNTKNAFGKDDAQIAKLKELVKELVDQDRIPGDIAKSEWGEFVQAVEA